MNSVGWNMNRPQSHYKISRGKPYTYYKMTWAKPDIHYKMTCQIFSSSPIASLQNASGSKRKIFQASSLQNDMHHPILTRLISTKIMTYRGHKSRHVVVVIGGGILFVEAHWSLHSHTYEKRCSSRVSWSFHKKDFKYNVARLRFFPFLFVEVHWS